MMLLFFKYASALINQFNETVCEIFFTISYLLLEFQFLNSIVRENKSDNGDDSYDPPQGLGINSKSIKALRSGKFT